jgi:SAM-dependent methyltransferase
MIISRLRDLLRRKHTRPDRFSLFSGERQTGLTLEAIRHDHIARYAYAAARVRERMQTQHYAFGLDIFCATGYGTNILARETACPVLGIDGSAEAIAVANQHYSSALTLFASKVFPFELPCLAFDFIVCLESIEHILETDQFLDQIIESLKPGGLLIVSTPNSAIWSLERNPNPFHCRHFSRAEIVSLLESNLEYGLHLTDWQGQNLYQFEEGRMAHSLESAQMQLMPREEGQILIFAFEKV